MKMWILSKLHNLPCFFLYIYLKQKIPPKSNNIRFAPCTDANLVKLTYSGDIRKYIFYLFIKISEECVRRYVCRHTPVCSSAPCTTWSSTIYTRTQGNKITKPDFIAVHNFYVSLDNRIFIPDNITTNQIGNAWFIILD